MVQYFCEGNIRVFWALWVRLWVPELLINLEMQSAHALHIHMCTYTHSAPELYQPPMKSPAKMLPHSSMTSLTLMVFSSCSVHHAFPRPHHDIVIVYNSSSYTKATSLTCLSYTIIDCSQFLWFICSQHNQFANSMSYLFLWTPNFIPIHNFSLPFSLANLCSLFIYFFCNLGSLYSKIHYTLPIA